MSKERSPRLYRLRVDGVWAVYVAWTTTKEAAYQLFKQHLAFYGSQLKKKNIEREENSLDELKEQHGVKLVVFGCPTKEKSHAT